jgi:hypothetical protein
MSVKYFAWDDAKNAKLRAERGIGFEEVVFHIERGDLLDILEHSNPSRYAPRWTAENRQFVDSAKPAIFRAAETRQFYFVPSLIRKSVCSFVRQLRGPHFSTWA